MRTLTRRTAVALLALATMSGCASTGATPRPRAEPEGSALPVTATPRPADRQRFVEFFARAYFPGRSGQIFIVPREGHYIADRDPLYGFMHGSPWDYDVHIPLIFHGAPFIRPGTYGEPALQQDIAPTLAALMGVAAPATVTGRALRQALAQPGTPPRVIALLVLDAMRADYFDTYASVMPTLSRLRREGAWFSETRVNYLPTVTSVGHATIGTGADPRVHGQVSNTIYNRVTGRSQGAYAGLDPGELMALTLADAWNLQTDGAAVIIGQGGAIRATAGLVGHGACLPNGRPVMAASYSTSDAGWETNPKCYTMPDALKAFSGRAVWEEAGGQWMGHDIASPSKFRASALFQRFEAEALMAVIDQSRVGADTITDLVLVNMKGPDYVAHAYGPESAELRETLAELDRQVAQFMALLDRKAGPSRSVVAITADHGTPGGPAGDIHVYLDDVLALLNQRFDPAGRRVVHMVADSANNQLYLDTARLASLGHSLDEVARFLETQPYIMAAFTEDEVRAGLHRAPQP